MTTKIKKVMSARQLAAGLHEGYYNAGNTGTAKTLDCANGSVQGVVLNGNATITLSGFVNLRASRLTVIVARDATTTRTLAWTGGTIITPGGTGLPAPAAVASSLNVYTFLSVNGGSLILANVAGIGYA